MEDTMMGSRIPKDEDDGLAPPEPDEGDVESDDDAGEDDDDEEWEA